MNDDMKKQWIAVGLFVLAVVVVFFGARLMRQSEMKSAPLAFASLQSVTAAYPTVITPSVGEQITCKAGTLLFTGTDILVNARSCSQGIFNNGFEVTP